MITTENIISQYQEIDQAILPDALKQGEFEFIKENIDLYNEDETIKKYIDTFVEKLNMVLSKSTKPETIEKNKPLKEKKAQATKFPKIVKKEQLTTKDASKPVEKVGLEISFIKRFVGLHGKTKEKGQILNFLSTLQKAIVEKRIRKTSPYAKEIENIQQQLIKCYGHMGNTIKIMLDANVKETYAAIAHSEKTMLSVLYIKQYIGLHGKQDVKEKAMALLDKIEKAVASGKIARNDPYREEITEIKTSLESYLNDKSKTPAIKESTLNGIMTWIANRQKKKLVAKYLQKIYETEKGLHGADDDPVEKAIPLASGRIISSVDLAGVSFATMGFTGKWLGLIGDPSHRFMAMIYGGPGSGKSTLALDFAYYLAKDHNKRVLYIANEEKVSKTLQDKQKLLQASHPNLDFVDVLNSTDFKNYDFIFIDSVNSHGLTPEYIEKITAQYPKLSVVYICQTTKSGIFRGSKEWEHFADVVIKTENGAARTEKNRFGGREVVRVFRDEKL